MTAIKLTQIGNSVGVNLSAYSPEFDTHMAEARKIMKKRKEVLCELAK
jgi:hypothetical protein